MKKLILLRGCSGAGKTTLAKKIELETHEQGVGVVICSTDEVWSVQTPAGKLYLWNPACLREAHALNRAKVDMAMQKGIEVIIVDNTNTTWAEIEPYVHMAIKHGYRVEVREPETEWKRNVEELAARNVHSVPKEVVVRQLGRFESTESIMTKIVGLENKGDC
jgi:predicted kinase